MRATITCNNTGCYLKIYNGYGIREYVALYSLSWIETIDQCKELVYWHKSLIEKLNPKEYVSTMDFRKFLGFGPLHSRDYSKVKRKPTTESHVESSKSMENSNTKLMNILVTALDSYVQHELLSKQTDNEAIIKSKNDTIELLESTVKLLEIKLEETETKYNNLKAKVASITEE